MTKYIHDEWCDLDGVGDCNCYVSLLIARDEHIAELKEVLVIFLARAWTNQWGGTIEIRCTPDEFANARRALREVEVKRPVRHIWEKGSTNRSVAGDEYDEIWDYVAQLEERIAELVELLEAKDETE